MGLPDFQTLAGNVHKTCCGLSQHRAEGGDVACISVSAAHPPGILNELCTGRDFQGSCRSLEALQERAVVQGGIRVAIRAMAAIFLTPATGFLHSQS